MEDISSLFGSGDNIVIPKVDFIKEHKHLVHLLRKYNIPALQKEATDQSEELKKMIGGFSKQSGFIRRLMAENKLKHKGEYKPPTYPLAPESTMNKPAEFVLSKLSSKSQQGSNTSPYGASPFILKHFGHATTEYETDRQKQARKLHFPKPMSKTPKKVESKTSEKVEDGYLSVENKTLRDVNYKAIDYNNQTYMFIDKGKNVYEYQGVLSKSGKYIDDSVGISKVPKIILDSLEEAGFRLV